MQAEQDPKGLKTFHAPYEVRCEELCGLLPLYFLMLIRMAHFSFAPNPLRTAIEVFSLLPLGKGLQNENQRHQRI